MSNKRQTYIDNYFKIISKSEHYSNRKRNMDISLKQIDNNILQHMKTIVKGIGPVMLPFRVPSYGRDSDDSSEKNEDDDVIFVSSKRPSKRTLTQVSNEENCDGHKKKSRKSVNQSTKRNKPEIKKRSLPNTKSDIETKRDERTNNSPVRKEISTMIGVYSPNKTQKFNDSVTSNESTSTNLDETILEGTEEYLSTNFMNVEEIQSSPKKIKILNVTVLNGDKTTKKSTEINLNLNSSTSKTVADATLSKEVKNEVDAKTEWDSWVLTFLMKIVKYVAGHKYLQKLLTRNEANTLKRFIELPRKEYAFFCFKLFTRKKKWYNVFQLRNSLKMNMHDREVMDMYNCLAEQGFVDTDYSSEPIDSLLNHLLLNHIKEVCVSFKLPVPAGTTKPSMIEKLILHSRRQSTLTFAKGIKDVLLEKIKDKLGYCIKMNLAFNDVLSKVHLLYTFVTNEFPKITDFYLFLTRVKDNTIIMPQFTVNENYEIFSSISCFSSFQTAYLLRQEVITVIENKSDYIVLYELCSVAYEALKVIVESDTSESDKPSCVQRFTPGYQYTKALSTGLNHLTKHYPDAVVTWLEFLLKQPKYCKKFTGSWYNTLIMVQYTHLKQHEKATHTLIAALKDETLSKIDLIDLNVRAEKIKRSKTNKISQMKFGEISSMQPILLDFPFIEIDAKAFRSEISGRKRHYYEKSETGMSVSSVEEIALKHYFRNGFINGLHCEGSLIVSMLFILFWDIIYGDKVPYAFISEIQYYPLDFMSKEFYINRKEEINKRLSEIEKEWSHEEFSSLVCDMWIKHSNKKSFINCEIVSEPKHLVDIMLCIGRLRLRKIMEHLIQDFRTYRSGLPDLFLWNVTDKKCKFVEVKGENDKLSSKQKFWLDFLRSVGADIEVCHVHTTGSKRKVRTVKKQDTEKPKTPKKKEKTNI